MPTLNQIGELRWRTWIIMVLQCADTPPLHSWDTTSSNYPIVNAMFYYDELQLYIVALSSEVSHINCHKVKLNISRLGAFALQLMAGFIPFISAFHIQYRLQSP